MVEEEPDYPTSISLMNIYFLILCERTCYSFCMLLYHARDDHIYLSEVAEMRHVSLGEDLVGIICIAFR